MSFGCAPALPPTPTPHPTPHPPVSIVPAEAVESMLEELLPHRLTEYLYDLASEWRVVFNCRRESRSAQCLVCMRALPAGRLLPL